MFTGLIEDVGKVWSLRPHESGARLVVLTKLPPADLEIGASIAVEGVCLTVVERTEGNFAADLSTETLRRTTFGDWRGNWVNLERPLALGERVGGHLVLGHVDGVGEIIERNDEGRFVVALPEQLMPLVVEKGSITLDGISLTVSGLIGKDRIALALIPETLRKTSWGDKDGGCKVNVEADILAKHVQRLLQFRSPHNG